MKHRKITPGWRYFKCNCNVHWRESCRDYQTLSVSSCPTKDCNYSAVSPYNCEEDLTIPVDKFGNLIQFELNIIEKGHKL